VAEIRGDDTNDQSARSPARLAIVLNGFGGAAIILAVLFFGGSFYVQSEIGRAFCLGAFFSGLLGGIVLFGFAKIIEMLDALRQETLAVQYEEVSDDTAEVKSTVRAKSPDSAA